MLNVNINRFQKFVETNFIVWLYDCLQIPLEAIKMEVVNT